MGASIFKNILTQGVGGEKPRGTSLFNVQSDNPFLDQNPSNQEEEEEEEEEFGFSQTDNPFLTDEESQSIQKEQQEAESAEAEKTEEEKRKKEEHERTTAPVADRIKGVLGTLGKGFDSRSLFTGGRGAL